jgi:predicted flavoprotein YhiN
MRNVIIIGSGPAGMTAAIYTARANLKPLVISGLERGGQVTLTNDLENYPGFPDGLGGFEMYQLLEKQAQKFGAEIIYDTVTRVDLSGEVKKVFAAGQEFDALSVIIATGSTPKRLGVLGEQEMIGRGFRIAQPATVSFSPVNPWRSSAAATAPWMKVFFSPVLPAKSPSSTAVTACARMPFCSSGRWTMRRSSLFGIPW